MGLSASEIREATFPESRRGFDPHEVRDYLARVADTIAELDKRLAAALADEEVMRHTLRAATQARNDLLAEAEEAAAAIRAQAQATAAAEQEALEGIRRQAEREADQFVAAGHTHAEALVAAARTEAAEMAATADDIVARAEAERTATLSSARAEAESLRAAAHLEAGHLTAGAEGIIGAAQKEAEELMATARREVDELLAAARIEATELATRAEVEQQVHQQRLAAAHEALAAVETIMSAVPGSALTGLTEAKAQLAGAYHSLGQVPQSPAVPAGARRRADPEPDHQASTVGAGVGAEGGGEPYGHRISRWRSPAYD